MPTIDETPCDWCGKPFLATPDNFVESGFSAFDEETDSADDWKVAPSLYQSMLV